MLKKTGGRQKGTPNKRTAEVVEILAKHKFNVVEEMILLYQKTECDEHTVGTAVKILTELASYIYPKRKSLEHSGEIRNPYMEYSVEELKALARERLDKK